MSSVQVAQEHADQAAFHARKQAYVSYHHLTEIPRSFRDYKAKSVSMKSIEENLFQKLSQRCISDKALYTEILRLFKDQHRRAGKDPMLGSLGIDKDDFHQLLSILGLFATKEQAFELFEKYDTNDSGNLSIHEFWVQARPSDYKTLETFQAKQVKDEMVMQRARKRMYIKESLLHTPVTTEVPSATVYNLPMERMLQGIRDKIRQKSMVDKTLSAQRTRRYLCKLFEYGDEAMQGHVHESVVRKVLNHINYAVGDHYIKALMNKFPGPTTDRLDYNALCLAVYPTPSEPLRTSGYVGGPELRRIPHHRPNTTGQYPSGSATARSLHGSRPGSRASRSLSRNGAATFRAAPRPPSSRRVVGSRPASRAYV